VYQVGFYYTHRDARSTKHKKRGNVLCFHGSSGYANHYSGTFYVHFLSCYLAQLGKVAPMIVDRNAPTLTSDYGALGLTL
jgi:hypothetical protein